MRLPYNGRCHALLRLCGISLSNARLGHTRFIDSFLSPFSDSSDVQGYGYFSYNKLVDYLDTHVIAYLPVPPRCHSKNVLYSSHGVTRSIFLSLTNADHKFATPLAAQQAVRIMKDLYGSHLLSAYELSKVSAGRMEQTHVLYQPTYSRRTKCLQPITC